MVVTLSGSNSFMLQSALDGQVQAFTAQHGDFGLERLDGEEATLDRMREAVTSLPFLSDKKMVVLRQPSTNKQFAEEAKQLIEGLPETTDLIIVEPKLDKRSSYYKYVKQHTEYKEFTQLDQSSLSHWLQDQAKQKQGTISFGDASYLIQRVGLNQQLLANELDKLLLYAPKVSREAIDALTEATPQSTIFELLDMAFNHNTQRTLRLYQEQRALKVEPQQIIAMLAWQLHILALIKYAGERSPDSIASEAKLSPYVVKKSVGLAARLPVDKLKYLITELATIDSRSKRETFAIDDAMQTYLLEIAI